MPKFHIFPKDSDISPTHVVTLDASTVLNVIERMKCTDADVECDGRYAFSVCLYDNGLWSIYHRKPPARTERVPRQQAVACLTPG